MLILRSLGTIDFFVGNDECGYLVSAILMLLVMCSLGGLLVVLVLCGSDINLPGASTLRLLVRREVRNWS